MAGIAGASALSHEVLLADISKKSLVADVATKADKAGNANNAVSGGEVVALAHRDATVTAKDIAATRAAINLVLGATSRLKATRPDVEGPYYRQGAPVSSTNAMNIVGDQVGEPLRISGFVLDTAGKPVAGARVELWQANNGGQKSGMSNEAQYDNSTEVEKPIFLRGELRTRADGSFTFDTIRAGRYNAGDQGLRPGHYHFRVSAPGYAALGYPRRGEVGPRTTDALVTQVYLHDDSYNARDMFWNADNTTMAMRQETAAGTTWSAAFDFVLMKQA